MRPYLFDDATIRCLDEIQNDLHFRGLQLLPNRFDRLGGVQLRLKKQSESRLDVVESARR